MVQATEIEQFLRVTLAPPLQTYSRRLSVMLADIANSADSPQALEQRLSVDPELEPAMRALAGETIPLGDISLVFSAEPQLERAVEMPRDGSIGLKIAHSYGREQEQHHAEQQRLVTITGGNVHGPVVGKNLGTIKYTAITINFPTGTRLDPARRPTIVRTTPPQAPLPVRLFYDRKPLLRALQPELQPRHAVWMNGPLGCGLTALLKQAANLPDAHTFADGIVYVDGNDEPPDRDDIIQRLYTRFYRSESGEIIRPDPLSAGTELGNLHALFLIDKPRLNSDQLAGLASTLAGRGAVLVTADGEAPDSLRDLALGGLPISDAIRLLSAEARIEPTQPATKALLQRLCEALGCIPLPLLLAGRLLRLDPASLAQLTSAAEDLRNEREPLARAAKLALMKLNDAQRAVLAALVRIGGPDADLETLSRASQLPKEIAEDALAHTITLKLVTIQDQRYAVIAASLRRILTRLLPRREERRAAALFLAGIASTHAGDMAWLGQEWMNLLSAARTALLEGQASTAGLLARTVQPYVVLNGLWGSWQRVIDLAEQAATASGDAALRAWTLHERGTRAGMLGDLTSADADLREAHRLRQELGDQAGADATLHNMAYLGLLPPGGTDTSQEPTSKQFWSLPIPIVVLVALLLAGGLAGALAFMRHVPAPTITAHPTSGSYPLVVTFRAAGGSSGESSSPTYIWNFDDGAVATTTDSTIVHRYTAPGTFHATLQARNSSGALSEQVSVTIDVANAPPTPVIELPAGTAQFTVGQALILRGSATDPEDGQLQDKDLKWTVLLHYGEDVQELLSPRTGNDIQIVAPAPRDLNTIKTSYLEISLTATDSLGRTGVVSKVLRPDIAQMTLATNPPGLHLTINNQPITAPYTTDLWSGSAIQVGAPEQLNSSGQLMVAEGWSDGGAATHTITTTSATAVYTATFVPLDVAFSNTTFTVDEGEAEATIAVTLNTASTSTIDVNYTTADGTASQGLDYTAASGTLTFAPGETSKTFTVAIADDQLDEPDETISLSLSLSGRGATITASSATLTILDNDPAPTIALPEAVAVPENAGAGTINVALSAPSAQTVTVDYATAPGTATEGQDYTATNGTLTFAPGETSKTIGVPIVDDQLSEGAETIQLTLSNPVNAVLGASASATMTIEDNDDLPSVAISSPPLNVPEDAGIASVVVTLSTAAGQPVTVDYASSDGTAGAPGDYTATNGTLTFAPGETSKTIDVPIVDDSVDEGDEQFGFALDKPAGAKLGSVISTTVTIRDNDPPPTVAFTAPDYQVNENAGTASIGVHLSGSSGLAIVVRYTIVEDGKSDPAVSSSHSGTLTFAPNETDKTIDLTIVDNTTDEPDRTARLVLSNPENATLGQQTTADLTIVDDDVPVIQFASAAYTMGEGNPTRIALPPATAISVTVVLDRPAWQPVTIQYATADGTAVAGQDYVAVQGALTFQPGQTSQSFMVRSIPDYVDEADETFQINLASPANASLGGSASAAVTIQDDDRPPIVQFSQSSYGFKEGDGQVTITVNLSGPSEQTITADYTTIDGTAVAGQDYTATSGRLVFAPGETQKTLVVSITQDRVIESTEYFGVSFSSVEQADKGADAQINIADDDLPIIK